MCKMQIIEHLEKKVWCLYFYSYLLKFSEPLKSKVKAEMIRRIFSGAFFVYIGF